MVSRFAALEIRDSPCVCRVGAWVPSADGAGMWIPPAVGRRAAAEAGRLVRAPVSASPGPARRRSPDSCNLACAKFRILRTF
jgi:hypothetical protein